MRASSRRDPSNNYSNSLLNKWIVKLRMLKRLELFQVHIEEETFEKIMSSCPSIQQLVLDSCFGLSSVKVNKARNLKHLECYQIISIEINYDAPSLETIRIAGGGGTWHLNKNNYLFFPRLKSLYLRHVHLPTEFFNNLSSNNCPCLQDLELHSCPGPSEFKLSNRSIKRLIINSPGAIKAIIDAPNMLYFEFSSGFLPTIYFAKTWREWKSVVKVWRSSHSNADNVSSSTWYLKLHEFLKALSHYSQISLEIAYLNELTNQGTLIGDSSCEPVVIQHLCLKMGYSPSSELAALLKCVFRICRPRYIGLPFFADSQNVWKPLEMRHREFWQQHLEESSIQVEYEETKEWHSSQLNILFRLKWRD